MKGNGGDPRSEAELNGSRALAAVNQETWRDLQEQMTEAGFLAEAENFDRWRRMGVKEESSR